MQLLLDFSDGSVSDTADGKNCMILSCAYEGKVTFTKAFCNITGENVKGLCGKYRIFFMVK